MTIPIRPNLPKPGERRRAGKTLKSDSTSSTRASGRIAGYARTCSDGEHRPSGIVPSVSVPFAKDGTVVSLGDTGHASSACSKRLNASLTKPAHIEPGFGPKSRATAARPGEYCPCMGFELNPSARDLPTGFPARIADSDRNHVPLVGRCATADKADAARSHPLQQFHHLRPYHHVRQVQPTPPATSGLLSTRSSGRSHTSREQSGWRSFVAGRSSCSTRRARRGERSESIALWQEDGRSFDWRAGPASVTVSSGLRSGRHRHLPRARPIARSPRDPGLFRIACAPVPAFLSHAPCRRRSSA